MTEGVLPETVSRRCVKTSRPTISGSRALDSLVISAHAIRHDAVLADGIAASIHGLHPLREQPDHNA